MFKKILVGHDHQAGGRDALELARMMAKATGAELVVAGVIPVSTMYAEADVVWKAEEDTFAEKIRAGAADADGEAHVFHSHSVARGLSDLAEEIGADAIVLGSSQRGQLGRILVGGTALQVIHGAGCAVMVAPVGFAAQDHGGLKSIVVGVDGEPEAQAAAEVAAQLAAATGAKATLVAVLQPPPLAYGKGGGSTHIGEVEAAVRELLQKALDRAASGFQSEPQTMIAEGDPAEELRNAAVGASLLVVGSRGHGPAGRILLGSTDANLLDSAPSPMLVWPRRAEVPRTPETTAHMATH